MATTYLITMQQVATAALKKLGVIVQGQTPDTDQMNDAIFALNVLAGRLFTLGMPAYKETIATITPTLGATSLAINVEGGLWNVYQAFLHDNTTNIDIPLRVISREEHNSYTNKTSQGTPVSVAISPDGLTVFPYLSPDANTVANKTIKLYGYIQNTVVTTSSDVLYFPREWAQALIYNLALNMAPELGTPLDLKQDIQREAKQYLDDAVNWNPTPTSVYFGASTYGNV